MHEFGIDGQDNNPPFDWTPDETTYPADSLDAGYVSPEILPTADNGAEGAADEPDLTSIVEYDTATHIGTGDHVVIAPTATMLFRPDNKNTAAVTNIVIPHIMAERQSGEQCSILDAGSSEGGDTWTMAAVLSAHDINYTLHGVDANSLALAQAEQPIAATIEEVRTGSHHWGTPDNTATFFEQTDAGHVRPTGTLRERVTFYQGDIRYEVPAGTTYDVVFANNIIGYYETFQPESIDAMVATVASALNDGGLFTFNNLLGMDKEVATDELLAAHGLVPAENIYGVPDEAWQRLCIYRKVANHPNAPS
jgi:chemotaxis methyl-accepting protein methylase